MHAPASDLPIALDKVCVSAGAVTIIDHISLTIRPGAPTILIGPNGSGKTTLLRLLMGLQAPTSGRITWGDRADATSEKRAIVFQRPTMLRRSVNGNLRYALRASRIPRSVQDERARDLLRLVGLESLGDRPARRLSGGEQQRLALARALAREPALLLLDEPAASLDPAAAKAIEDIIDAVSARGVKIVMATHNLGQARRIAGDVVVLHRGRVIESGPASDVLENPKLPETKAFISGELLV